MKRFLLAALIFMMAFTVVFAQDAGTFSAGIRGGLGIGFNDNKDVDFAGYKTDSLLHPVIAAYGYYTFAPNMAVQFETNIMINQGLKYSANILGWSANFEVSYMSLDIPVMFRYTFLNQPVNVGLVAGPHISIPISKVKLSSSGSSTETDMEGFGFGATAGVFVGYPLGPGRIIGDLRFLFDFAHPKVKGRPTPFMNRRALNISVGYEMTF